VSPVSPTFLVEPPLVATERFSIRGSRVAFFSVVVLLAGVSAFTLYSELRTAQKVDQLVSDSLEREQMIALIRVDAVLLKDAVDAHINASDDEERDHADRAMDVVKDEIRRKSEDYAKRLPRGERDLYNRLNTISETLVKKASTTIKYSNRKEAERARAHLEEEVTPLTFELDEIAAELQNKNKLETSQVVRQLEALRLRTTLVSTLAVSIAMLVSLLIAFQVTRVLKRQEETITAQLAELNRRNQELDSFASRVAHDLVAPLSPLKGYLTLARRGAGDEKVKELLTQAESSTARMTELVEALLNFCRAGKTREGASGELDTAVTTILLEVSQAAAAAGVKLERNLQPRVLVKCPPQLLQSIAQNLLSNAVKYSAGRPDAKVSVSVAKVGGEAVLAVSDNGPGMNPQSVAMLFQPFFRAPEMRAMPGHGLGLATTKRLVDAHGGNIAVDSREGRGTTFTVKLPLVEAMSGDGAAPTPAEVRA
jgi:two-component system, OmpR family, sensor kinase